MVQQRNHTPPKTCIKRHYRLSRGFKLLGCLTLLGFFASCRVPVYLIDPESSCEQLRKSYPSDYGLILFDDVDNKVRSIPWCFPSTAGFGVIGYNIDISISRAGILSLVLSDIRPSAQFGLTSIHAKCKDDATGKSFVTHGYGTEWAIPVKPGDYCFALVKTSHQAENVWFTLTATRP